MKHKNQPHTRGVKQRPVLWKRLSQGAWKSSRTKEKRKSLDKATIIEKKLRQASHDKTFYNLGQKGIHSDKATSQKAMFLFIFYLANSNAPVGYMHVHTNTLGNKNKFRISDLALGINISPALSQLPIMLATVCEKDFLYAIPTLNNLTFKRI